MRFLKSKVHLKQVFSENESSDESSFSERNIEFASKLQTRLPSPTETIEKGISKGLFRTGRKKIIKNYEIALCAFASSDLAFVYLESIIKNNSFDSRLIPTFMAYIKEKQGEITFFRSLRKLLVIKEGDNKEISTYKQIFKGISIIFLKYFSVNWIYGGELSHKSEHLKYRLKFLRKIQKLYKVPHFT